jgi:hypothetical protein
VQQLDQMWALIFLAHTTVETLGSRGILKRTNGTGCLYVMDRTQDRIGAAVAGSTEAAWRLLVEDVDGLHRSDALWVPGERDRIRRDSPILQVPFSALRRGRPYWLTDPGDADRLPAVGGVYRALINPPKRRPWQAKKRARMYVGRSSNVHRRLRELRHHQFLRHYKWGGPDGIKRIEVLIVKSAAGAHVWTNRDLDAAEAWHINRAAEKGLTVLNKTSGGNGSHGHQPEHAHWWQPDPTGKGAHDSGGSADVGDPYDHDDPVEN